MVGLRRLCVSATLPRRIGARARLHGPDTALSDSSGALMWQLPHITCIVVSTETRVGHVWLFGAYELFGAH